MKATYSANKKKISTNSSYVPRWEYFKMLQFLDGELDEKDDETFDEIIEYLDDNGNEDESINPSSENGAGNNCDNGYQDNGVGSNENVEICDENNGAGRNKNGAKGNDKTIENRGNSWSYDEEEILIFFNESYPELWDHKEPDYKKAKKSALLDDLCSDLNFKFRRKYSYYLFIHFDSMPDQY